MDLDHTAHGSTVTHLSLLSTGSTEEELCRHNCKIVHWDIKNQIKQTNHMHIYNWVT